MPTFYHKGVNSLKSQFGLLVVSRLILYHGFRYPNILFKKYSPLHAVQDTNMPCFSHLYLCWFTRIEDFFAVFLTHFIIHLSFFGVNLWAMSSPGFMKYLSRDLWGRLYVGLNRKKKSPSLSLKNLMFSIKST